MFLPNSMHEKLLSHLGFQAALHGRLEILNCAARENSFNVRASSPQSCSSDKQVEQPGQLAWATQPAPCWRYLCSKDNLQLPLQGTSEIIKRIGKKQQSHHLLPWWRLAQNQTQSKDETCNDWTCQSFCNKNMICLGLVRQ